MTAPTLEGRPDRQVESADRFAVAFLWVVPTLGFVAAVIGSR